MGIGSDTTDANILNLINPFVFSSHINSLMQQITCSMGVLNINYVRDCKARKMEYKLTRTPGIFRLKIADNLEDLLKKMNFTEISKDFDTDLLSFLRQWIIDLNLKNVDYGGLQMIDYEKLGDKVTEIGTTHSDLGNDVMLRINEENGICVEGLIICKTENMNFTKALFDGVSALKYRQLALCVPGSGKVFAYHVESEKFAEIMAENIKDIVDCYPSGLFAIIDNKVYYFTSEEYMELCNKVCSDKDYTSANIGQHFEIKPNGPKQLDQTYLTDNNYDNTLRIISFYHDYLENKPFIEVDDDCLNLLFQIISDINSTLYANALIERLNAKKSPTDIILSKRYTQGNP